jgi:hypothetical protein
MIDKRKGDAKHTPETKHQCSGKRPSTALKYKIFALYQWLRWWSIAVFNLLKTIL